MAIEADDSVAPLVVRLALAERIGLSDEDMARFKRGEKVLLPLGCRGTYGFTFMVLQHERVPSE